jgi:hypothetical protein
MRPVRRVAELGSLACLSAPFMEHDPDSRFTAIASLSVMFLIYGIWALYLIAQPEFPFSLLAFPMVILSPILFGVLVWRLRRDWSRSWGLSALVSN